MQPRSLLGILLTLLLVELVALLLFAYGFFPQKTYLPPRTTPTDDVPTWPGQSLPPACEALRDTAVEPPHSYTLLDACFGVTPQYDRLVFMVVDALRHDFALGPTSRMTFTHQKIKEKHGIPFISRATAPTVTLPRIKALSTGMVPNFQDAILNIVESNANGATNNDNWLFQLHQQRHKRFIFYGDETWLNFAEPLFKRYEGTSSFYVADTVEVDTNVTRHVEPELAKSDWDIMILHYLGLDHIGHSAGPKSPLMGPKQREMDDVVRVLYERTRIIDQQRMATDPSARPTLIILCGDHGMNDIGGHGGSSPGETSPIDVVPTISLLFGVPCPRNSLGNLIPELFESLSPLEKIRALQLNAYQIRSMFVSLWHGWNTRCLDDHDMTTVDCDADMNEAADELVCMYEQAVYYHALAMNEPSTKYIERAAHLYQKFSEKGAQQLTQDFSSYGLTSMFTAMIMMAICTLTGISLFNTVVHSVSSSTTLLFVRRHDMVLVRIEILLIILYAIGLFSSSYIEEEHQMWYFIIQTLWLSQVIVGCSSMQRVRQQPLFIYPLLQMILMRLLRVWNQTGQKYADQLDIRFYLNTTYTDTRRVLMYTGVILVCLWGLYVALVAYRHRSLLIRKVITMLATIITSGTIILYKLAYEIEATPDMTTTSMVHDIVHYIDKLHLARIAYGGVAILLVAGASYTSVDHSSYVKQQRTHRIHLCLVAITLLLLLLARMHNLFVFVLFGGQLYLLIKHTQQLRAIAKQSADETYNEHSITMQVAKLSILTLALQHAAFFVLGNSNALSSVELNNAYIGLTSFIPAIVGLLAFICNWSGPIWWMVASMLALSYLIESDTSVATANQQSLSSTNIFNGDDINEQYSEEKSQLTKHLNNSPRSSCTPINNWTRSIIILLWINKLFFSISLLCLSIAVTILRYHLFIWTVFSPKYLYQAFWMGFHLVMTSAWLVCLAQSR
ncbi:hypothetical protein BDF22DRAFT_746437 [Syncephalis plumigaleata]|nr:hypothetical protein BDF22DRAFT_746437 [Syncephalis plumigaleata]